MAEKKSSPVLFWFSLFGIFYFVYWLFSSLFRKGNWNWYIVNEQFGFNFALPIGQEETYNALVDSYKGHFLFKGVDTKSSWRKLGFPERLDMYCKVTGKLRFSCSHCGNVQNSLCKIRTEVEADIVNEAVSNCLQFWLKIFKKVYNRYYIWTAQKVALQTIHGITNTSNGVVDRLVGIYKLSNEAISVLKRLGIRDIDYYLLKEVVMKVWTGSRKIEDIVSLYMKGGNHGKSKKSISNIL
jgi:hypothetical protein